jgi:hypothetical protein
VSGTIDLPNTGRHVDVVIADGHINPGHPEFAKNADGTGGSRVKQYKWFEKHWEKVLGTRPTKTVNGVTTFNDYEYDFSQASQLAIDNDNHGAATAAISAGNTCGFARDANIYNIHPYGTSINYSGLYGYFLFDFIRQFHLNKPVNSVTGRKNPTIVNMSFGITGYGRDVDLMQQIVYKGRTISRPTGGWTEGELNRVGMWFNNEDNSVTLLQRDTSMDNGVIDGIAEGIIFCGSAMNNNTYGDAPGGDHYNDAAIYSWGVVNYHRGGSPGSAPGCISVGALDASVEEKRATYSNNGPRVDIYAPADETIAASNPKSLPITITAVTTTTTQRPFRATCTFDPYPNLVSEGSTVTFGVTVTGVPSGTLMYWANQAIFKSGPGLADPYTDFGDEYVGSFTIDSSGRGTFSIPIMADQWTEGAETFTVGIYDLDDEISMFRRPIAITNPIAIVDTSTGDNNPPGIDSRNTDYPKRRFNGTSSACPHVTGIIACALESYPNMTPSQALSYIQTYASHGVLTDIPFITDPESVLSTDTSTAASTANQWFSSSYTYSLFNGPNKYATYQPNTRPNQVQPAIGHKSRPATGGVYPRTRIKRT